MDSPQSSVNSTLWVRAGAAFSQSFLGPEVTIGSSPTDTVSIKHPGVKRRHIVARMEGDRWVARAQPVTTIQQLPATPSAAAGIQAVYVDQHPVTFRIGSFSGAEVTLQSTPARTATVRLTPISAPALSEHVPAGNEESLAAELAALRKRVSRQGWAIRACIAVLVLFFGTFVLRPGRTQELLIQNQLADVKQATVRLLHREDDGSFTWGSGTIIDESGLILTNAHVANPSAPGLQLLYGPEFPKPDPPWFEVAMVTGGGESLEYRYRARLVVADGYLDLAVVQIVADEEGNPLAPDARFPTVDIGSSGGLATGDPVYVVGFPDLSGGGSAQRISGGLVAAWLADERLDNIAHDEIDTTADIVGGNSGGAMVNGDGELIAVPRASLDDEDASVSSGRARPVELAESLIETAKNGTSPEYVSPFVTQPTGDETATLDSWSRWSVVSNESTCGDRLAGWRVIGEEWLCATFSVSQLRPTLDVLLAIPKFDISKELDVQEGVAICYLKLPPNWSKPVRWRLDIGGGAETIATGVLGH